MGIMVVTFYSMDTNEYWNNTKIEIGNGIIDAANQEMISVVCQEILLWMRRADEAAKNVSDIQKEKILEKMQALGSDIQNYPIFQDWLDDMALK